MVGRRSIGFAAGGAAILLAATAHTAGPAYLIKDINEDPLGIGDCQSGPRPLVIGGVAYFAATTPATGCELWRSDGTEAGTRIVKDIVPGEGGGFGQLTAVGSTLYFIETPGLWRSDGTEVGTTLVMETAVFAAGQPMQITAALGRLYFVIPFETTPGGTLWVSDGTTGGTKAVDGVPPKDSGPWLSILGGGDALYLFSQDSMSTNALWISDGTASGTTRLGQTANNAFTPFVASGGLHYYLVSDSVGRSSLWRTDGTESGTQRLFSPSATSGEGLFSEMVDAGGTFYFTAVDSFGPEVWTSDGTAAGTHRATNVPSSIFAPPRHLTPSGTSVFFTQDDGVHGEELWRTDGTEAGTAMVADVDPAPGKGSLPWNLTIAGGGIYFVTQGADHVGQLWRSDGAAGAEMIADFSPAGARYPPAQFVDLGGKLFFQADDSTHSLEPWTSDGTASGTAMVRDIDTGTNSSMLDGRDFATVGDVILFLAGAASKDPFTLWRSDGTEVGTYQMNGKGAFGLTRLGDRVYFISTEGDHFALWQTDGTPDGTTAVTPVVQPAFDETSMAALGGSIYISARDALWKVDVTSPTPKPTLVRAGWGTPWWPKDLTTSGPYVYFVITSAENERRLWRTDGTDAGTIALGAGPPAANYFDPPTLTDVGGTLYYLAGEEADRNSARIWRSAGTPETTAKLAGPYHVATDLAAMQGQLFFVDRANFFEPDGDLWISNGSSSGTKPVGIGGKRLSRLTAASPDGPLLFNREDAGTGVEPWVSWGTPASSDRVQDIFEGPAGSRAYFLGTAGSRFFFAATTEAGREPWAVPMCDLVARCTSDSPFCPKDRFGCPGPDGGSGGDGGTGDGAIPDGGFDARGEKAGGGCGCRIGASHDGSRGLAFVGLVIGLVMRRRSRRGARWRSVSIAMAPSTGIAIVLGAGMLAASACTSDSAISAPDGGADARADAGSGTDGGPTDAVADTPAVDDQPGRAVPPCPAGPEAPGPRVGALAEAGSGPCAGRTLADVIAAIRAGHPELDEISVFEGPDAGYFDGSRLLAFRKPDGGFAIVFVHGWGDCPSGCIDHEYFYFQTDGACAPVVAGHFHPSWSSRDGGSCRALEGLPQWGVPPPPDPADVCDGDLGARDLKGIYRVHAKGMWMTCAESADKATTKEIDGLVDLSIAQDPADLGRGAVSLTGTGHPLLEGVSIPATFRRLRFEASKSESNLPSSCPRETSVSITYDFECIGPHGVTVGEFGSSSCGFCKGGMWLTLEAP